MTTKLLGAIIFLGLGFLLCKITTEQEQSIEIPPQVCTQLTPAQQLASLIENDFQNLSKTDQLPLEWFSISRVETRVGSLLANAILGQERPKFKRIKEGSNYLELEIMDMPDDVNPGIIVQASLFDNKSQNKIFEIGRTYSMKQLNRQDTNNAIEAQ